MWYPAFTGDVRPAQTACGGFPYVACRVHSGFFQFPPEAMRRFPQGTHPIVENADLYPLAGFVREHFCELPADIISMDDVALEMDRFPRGTQSVQPCGIIFGGVFQERNTVATGQGGSCGP